MTTKERILDEALVCFATKGYKGTNLRDLAAGLGLSKSALYKHYPSKEAIWNSVLDQMETYYSERFGSPERLPEAPTSCEELLQMSMQMIAFTIRDPKVILTRQLLLIEQFRDERARYLATLHFFTGTKTIFTHLFEQMMANGSLKPDDPEMLALAYTTPISALIHLCDREPEKEADIIQQIEAFIRHFIHIYGINS